MTAHEIHALSGAYAMDALDDVERARFEKHLAACAECRAEVASLQDATLLLSQLTEVAPPAAMRAKVLADIKKVRPLPPLVAKIEARRPRRWMNLVAAAAVLGVLGGTAVVVNNANDNVPTLSPANAKINKVLQATDVQHVTTTLADGTQATAFRSRLEHTAVLITKGMQAAPADHVYQLWFRKDGRMISAGLMGNKADQRVLLKGDANNAVAVGVTVEPKGGSNAPTSAPVAFLDFEKAT